MYFRRPFSFVTAGAAMLLAGSPACAEDIVWSTDRPLRWTDFTGPVARDAPDESAAMTLSGLKWRFQYSIRRSGNACSYAIDEITTLATFSTEASWVKTGKETEVLLAHEQGHFDITEIYRLMLDRAAQAFIGSTGVCAGSNERRISNFVEARIAESLDPLYQRIWQAHVAAQAAYDRDSDHGRDAASQGSWLERIAAGLSGERWDEFAPDGQPIESNR